ncbi:MAG: ferredoxin [Candidatus Micrarchaeota archaeon]
MASKTPKIDRVKCIGCGACASICPDVFEVDSEGKARVKNAKACENCDCDAAANGCPVGAITLE